MPIVHLYSRFSHISQAGGDSLKRQQKAAEDFCKRHGYTLSSERYHDAGRSGWQKTESADGSGRLLGKQRALNAFMRAVEDGRVRSGDILLVEHLDRLSRKGIKTTRQLIDKILDTGVQIAILSPSEKIYTNEGAEGDIGSAIELAAMAFTANAYSESLSKRVRSAYASHRRAIVEGKESRFANPKKWASMPPSWLEWDAEQGAWRQKPDRVKAIQYAFKRMADGIGRTTVVRELNEKFPPPGGRVTSRNWNGPFLTRLLKTKNVLGVLESSHGEVIEGYYPAIVTKEVWTAANVSASKNRRVRALPTQHVNMLGGLLFSARDGAAMHSIATVSSRTKRDGSRYIYRRFHSWHALQGIPGADRATMDTDRFEGLLLELLPKLELNTSKGKADALRNERAYLQSEVDSLQAQIKNRTGSATVLGPVLVDLSKQLEAVEASIREVGTATATPTLAYRKRLASMQRGTAEERQALHDALHAVVRKIEVLGVKQGTRRCDRVRSLIEIEFRNGEFARGLELPDGSVAVVKGPKLHKRLSEQLAGGWEFGPSQYAASVKLAGMKRRP